MKSLSPGLSHPSGGDRWLTKKYVLCLKGNKADQGLERDELGR